MRCPYLVSLLEEVQTNKIPRGRYLVSKGHSINVKKAVAHIYIYIYIYICVCACVYMHADTCTSLNPVTRRVLIIIKSEAWFGRFHMEAQVKEL